jgi:hypothetical protein
MLYEGLKQNSTIVIVPSTAVESMTGVICSSKGKQSSARPWAVI